MPVFLSVVRKKNSERISEATSAIGNANQTLRSTPPRKPRDDNSGDVVRSMFEAMGEELLRSAR